MLTYLKESLLFFRRNKPVMFLIMLTGLLGALKFIDIRILKILIFFIECILIVILYVNILTTNNDQSDFFVTTKNALRYLPRYAWLFVYFLVSVIIIVPLHSIILKRLLENLYSVSLYREILFYGNFTLVVVLLSPFYLYAPAFLVLNNCFVYESIHEAYKFVKAEPLKRIAPSLFILITGYLLGRISKELFIVYFATNLFFYLIFFCSVFVAAQIFKESNTSYVSMKTKIEKGEWPKKVNPS